MAIACASCPPGLAPIASTANAPLAGMADEERRLLRRAVPSPRSRTRTRVNASWNVSCIDICGCPDTWQPGNIVAREIELVRRKVGDGQCAARPVRGGRFVVVAALLHEAIGDQLTCVFVDHGLLRLREGDQVMATFGDHLGVKVIRVDAERAFPRMRWSGVTDPEQKRKIIGRLFIEVFDEEAGKLADIRWLAQGTIYPDVIESAGGKTGKAHVIKSHHNVGGLPDDMRTRTRRTAA